MKRFHFTADAYLEAEDIDDALLKISEHLQLVAFGDAEAGPFIADSHLTVEPVLLPLPIGLANSEEPE